MEEQRMMRASMLLEQNRLKEAEKELRGALSSNPENPEALALLALCVSGRGDINEALRLIRQALEYGADEPRYLYIYAQLLMNREVYAEAEKVIKSAISIYPMDGDFYALLANLKLRNKEWQDALDAAENGLSVDADNLSCLNARSTALIKLDRKEEAYETIKEALNKDPENSYTHANLGYGMLEKGDHRQALEHFRKALQLDPESEFAKAGMVQGLKARYLVYRWFLKYAFWIGNMKNGLQWVVIIGFYFGSRVLRYAAAEYPALSPFIMPVVIAYFAFAFSTWIIGPLSNLFLRLNVYGRYALDRDEIKASTFVGICLAGGLIAGILFFVTNMAVLGTIAVVSLTMMLPVAATFKREGTGRIVLGIFTGLLALIGVVGILQAWGSGNILTGFGYIYLLGIVAFQWVANIFVGKS